MKQHPAAFSVCKFLKAILCLALLTTVLVSLTACGGNEGKVRYVDGKYYDDAVNPSMPLSDDQVTLDIIAQYEYGKYFDKLKEIDQRQAVIRKYLMYHLPASTQRDTLVLAFMEHSITDTNIPSEFEDQLCQTDDFLSNASTVLSLANFCAEMQGDTAFGDFIKKIDKSELAENALQIVKAGSIIADLSNNTIENKQEYCEDLISAFQYLTGFIPIWDDYFDEGLNVIKEGIDLVLSENRTWEKLYSKALDDKFFTYKKGEIRVFQNILRTEKYWNDNPALCPTIADIFSMREDFVTLSSDGIKYLKEYIIYRIDYEMKHPEYRGVLEEEKPEDNYCSQHKWMYSDNTATCESAGTQRQYCNQCPFEQIIETPPRGHDYGLSSVTEPTCSKKGYTTYTCSRCEFSYTGDVTEKLPHNFEDTVIPPTLESQGYTLHTCVECGESLQDTFVEPLCLPDLSQGNAWLGYEISPPRYPKRFELIIEQMTPDQISGSLETSVLYETKYHTSFTGTGTICEGIFKYTLILETPVDFGYGLVYDTITLLYHFAEDRFELDGCYDNDLYRVCQETPPTLVENATWSGLDKDPFYNRSEEDHEYVVHISKMNAAQISGYFTLSYQGTIDHESEFTGRGFQAGNLIYYEILLSTSRTKKHFTEVTIDALFLVYDTATDTFEITGPYYDADLARQ